MAGRPRARPRRGARARHRPRREARRRARGQAPPAAVARRRGTPCTRGSRTPREARLRRRDERAGPRRAAGRSSGDARRVQRACVRRGVLQDLRRARRGRLAPARQRNAEVQARAAAAAVPRRCRCARRQPRLSQRAVRARRFEARAGRTGRSPRRPPVGRSAVRGRSRGGPRGSGGRRVEGPRAVQEARRHAAGRGGPRLQLGARRDDLEQHVGQPPAEDLRAALGRACARRRHRPGYPDGHRRGARGHGGEDGLPRRRRRPDGQRRRARDGRAGKRERDDRADERPVLRRDPQHPGRALRRPPLLRAAAPARFRAVLRELRPHALPDHVARPGRSDRARRDGEGRAGDGRGRHAVGRFVRVELRGAAGEEGSADGAPVCTTTRSARTRPSTSR